MPTKEETIFKILQEIPLFSDLTDSHLQKLVDYFETTEVGLGKNVGEEGETIDAMYIVYDGSLRLKKTTPEGKRKSIGKKKVGQFIGENVFMPDSVWEFSATSSDNSLLLRLSRPAIDDFLNEHPDVAELLNQRVALDSIYHKVYSLLGDSKEAERLKVEITPKLNSLLGVLYVAQGEEIFHQNDKNSSYYLLQRGKIELVRHTVEGRVSLGYVENNEFFGEAGVLSGRNQDTTALAITGSVVIVIPNQTMRRFLEINPDLRQKMINRVNFMQSEETEQVKILQQNRKTKQDTEEAPSDQDDKAGVFEKQDTKIKKFPWLRQHDETDCGAACLTMISRYYGIRLSMGRVREMADVSTNGATMSSMCKAGEALGYRARGLKSSYTALAKVKLPCIIHWEGYHWVVLYRIDSKHVWLADPDKGLRKLSKEEFNKGWTGYVIELEPTEKLKTIEQDKHPIFFFLNYLKPYRMLLAEIGLAALIMNLLGLASPLFLQAIIDNVIVNQDVGLLNMMLLGMVLVAFFSSLTGWVQQFLSLHITTRLDLKMLADFFQHILSLPMNFFHTRRKGDILTRFGENSTIRNILTNVSISIFLSLLMILVYTTMLFAYSVKLALVAFAFIPGFILLSVIFSPIFVRLSNEAFMANAEQSSHMVESITAIETIKANAIESAIRSKWENHYIQMVNLTYRNTKAQLLVGALRQILNTGSMVTILWYGAHLVMGNEMTLGELMGFNTLLGSVMGPIMGLVGLWDTYKMATVSMDRVNDVLQTKPEKERNEESTGGQPINYVRDVTGDITFDNVNFRYGDRDSPLILNGLNLEIKAGQTVALVGKSGCGKSTVIRLIMGFYLPTDGSLRIDGQDIRQLDLKSLRRNVGIVLQDSFLFSGTIAENIALGEEDPSEDALIEAANLASAHEFITQLPAGYETIVGERGISLSGGQRQRICIARALFHKPKILIFDEATSALDTESERRIQENMSQILHGRTAIVIAHRLSTVRDADMICYLDNGVIAEKGPHKELVAKKGYYYNLVTQQISSG